MRCIFLAPLMVLSSLCFGQLPDYIPADGLVAWYSLNGNGNDQSGNENHLIEVGEFEWAAQSGVPYVEFEGEGQYMYHPDQSFPDVEEFSIAIWFRNDQWSSSNGVGGLRPVVSKHYSSGDGSFILFGDQTSWHVANNYNFDHSWETNQWHHVAASWTSEGRYVYADGELVLSESADLLEITDDLFMLGGWLNESFSSALSFDGAISSVGLWDRGLSQEEIGQLYSQQAGLPGCMTSNACNFNAEATYDDGSCYYSICLCLDGTVWSDELGGCIPATTCPQDLDFDGVVGVNDLMNLLSAFGTPCEPLIAEWTCGDPVSYHGYDYATVQIGEQCWFAENLRTEFYQNGDSIANSLSDEEWISTIFGATAIYGEDDGCSDFAPTIDACDPQQSLMQNGRLYNFYAVASSNQLCPASWHVPSDTDWIWLESYIGLPDSLLLEFGWRGDNQSYALKAEFGWADDWVGEFGGGENSFGFTALPGGDRHPSTGHFSGAGLDARFWTSSVSETGEGSITRRLVSYNNFLIRETITSNSGWSVRCLKDTEE